MMSRFGLQVRCVMRATVQFSFAFWNQNKTMRGAVGDVVVRVCARTRFAGGHFFFLAMVWYSIEIQKKLKNFPRARAPEILRAVHPKVGI